LQYIRFVFSVRQAAYLLYENLSATGAASVSAGGAACLAGQAFATLRQKPAKTDASVFLNFLYYVQTA
jgi:hypothetical protein